MIGLLQRVSTASVEVAGETVASIGPGLMILVGIEKQDGSEQVERLAHKMLHYRMFSDAEGRMNLNVMETEGGVLLVPQFTLAANTGKGLRPSFNGASPEMATALFEELKQVVESSYRKPGSGVFGADMSVNLCNEGPVTFWLQVGQ